MAVSSRPILNVSTHQPCVGQRNCAETLPSCNMECSDVPNPTTHPKPGFGDFARPPSPGMDINWQMGDDLQLWGHLHGYGDSAECIPDDDFDLAKRNVNGNNNSSLKFRGLQARGWH